MMAAKAQAQDADSPPYDPMGALATIDAEPQALAARGVMREELGALALPSGRIVAVDPLVVHRIRAFALKVPPGRYAVELIKPVDEPTRTALAAIRLNACKVALWQPAAPEGASIASLKANEIFGYGVDAGTGSFADIAFYGSFGRHADGRLPGPDYANYSEITLFEMIFPDNDSIPRDVITERDGAGLALWSSGYGDGFYASYWGFSAEGCPCVLATDYAILEQGAAWDYDADKPAGPPMPVADLRYSTDPAETGRFEACRPTS